ncbi:hypothetical protein [Clostridium sporogenes]|uniref:hypothetical protein n=1 Tax=Clostridium sporogenes TaxID=1509 RepID=UPI002237B1DF|nr:hypothetical protein [Clostridium sporogenes]MCW6107825.1 hypothetical protein [Clostridium sporogenes]
MEEDYIFPIAVKKEGDEVIVRFIDFDIQEQRYKSKDDYITESKIILSNILLEYEQKRLTIPLARKLELIKTNKDEQIIFLNIWLPFYRTENEKYVKKTLTIPEWIDVLGKKQNLNFSQILKEALLEELGLHEEVKKRKRYKFNKPMRKLEDFLVLAQKMIKANIEEETDIFLLACRTKDFNLIVTLWVIWANKNISSFLTNYKKEDTEKIIFKWNKQGWIEHTKSFKIEFKNNVDEKCDEIVNELKEYNIQLNSINVLGKYIKKFAEWILNSSLKYDGIFERNESIYDYMRAITSRSMLRKNIKKDYWEEYEDYYLFTLHYEIEVPYIFILAWNIEDIYVKERFNTNIFNKGREKNNVNMCYKCLKKVSNTMLEVLLGNSIFSECLEGEVRGTRIKDNEQKPIITREGNVNLSGYLPYIQCNDQNIREYTDTYNKMVSKEVLTMLPMTPIKIRGGDKIGLKYLLHLLCAELEK